MDDIFFINPYIVLICQGWRRPAALYLWRQIRRMKDKLDIIELSSLLGDPKQATIKLNNLLFMSKRFGTKVLSFH